MTRNGFLELLKTRDYAGVSKWIDSGKNREWLHERNGSRCTPLIKMRVKPRPSGRGRKARSDIENVAAMAD